VGKKLRISIEPNWGFLSKTDLEYVISWLSWNAIWEFRNNGHRLSGILARGNYEPLGLFKRPQGKSPTAISTT
jgi:hypothetical protein